MPVQMYGAMMKLRTTILIAGLALSLVTAGCGKSDDLQEGKTYFNKGDFAAAVIALKNAVSTDPKSIEARVMLGEALERAGDLAGSEQQFRRAVELGGNANELVPRITQGLLDRGQMALLVKDFGGTELPDPEADSELRGILAMANLALGRKGQVTVELLKARFQTPAVRLARAQIALQGNRHQDALVEIEASLQQGKVPWWFWRAASRIYADGGDAGKALSAIKTSHELAPWHPGVLGEHAEQLIKANKIAEAMPLRQQLKKMAPTYYRTYLLDALFYAREGKNDEAHVAATRVLNAVPDHIPAQLLAATVELNRGELSSVHERLKKVLARNPASLEALHLQIALELRRGNNREATQALSLALKHAPNDPGFLTMAANLAWVTGDRLGAIKKLGKALELSPKQPRLYLRMTEMKHALGKREEALEAIGRAIELAPDDARFREEVYQLLIRLRMHDKARSWVDAEMARRPKDAAPIFWNAILLGSEGKRQEALELTRRALDIQADYRPALSALARGASTPDGMKEYQARLQKAIDTGTKDPHVFIEQARVLAMSGGSHEKVGTLLERGVSAAPAAVELREVTVRHWLAWGRKDKTEVLIANGEAALPDNIEMLALSAWASEAMGNHETSLSKYKDLSVRFPTSIRWGQQYALSLARNGKRVEAISFMQRLISRRGDDLASQRILVELLLEDGKTQDALVTAKALQQRPEMKVEGLLLEGDVHAKAGEKNLALKAFAEAEKMGAGDKVLARQIGLLDKTDAIAAANAELNNRLAARPGNVPLLFVAARRYLAQGNRAEASKQIEEIVRLQPKNAIALNELAWIYAQSGDKRALGLAQRAAELLPSNPAVLDTLALTYAKEGKAGQAAYILRGALMIDPLASAPRLHLAELLLAAGKKDEARGLLKYLDERSLNQEESKRLVKLKEQI